MPLSEIKNLILNWGAQHVSSDFGEEHMKKDISLLGLDSLDVVEFCEYLELKFGIEADVDWVMEFETLSDLADQVKVKLER